MINFPQFDPVKYAETNQYPSTYMQLAKVDRYPIILALNISGFIYYIHLYFVGDYLDQNLFLLENGMGTWEI